jgi:poly-beta-1,6-N-acetyl-D-glucosamine synthase
MVWFLSFFTLAGYNFSFWLFIGSLRYFIEEVIFKKKEVIIYDSHAYTPQDVAVIIPAHNEEQAISRTLHSLFKIVPKENIHVASDYSTDRTNKIVTDLGVKLMDIRPNIGKAKALVAIMKHYQLLERFPLIMINDADTTAHSDCLNIALPFFKDSQISAIATHGVSRPGNYSLFQKYFIYYRIRLWRILQLGMRFGQTWKYTNVSFIVPGSLSIYRARALRKIEIDAPGLVIEDFNMTFELHRKKLGKIGYTNKIIGVTQDPYNLKDYIKQVQRWNVGFFQTYKRNGVWPSFFWFSTTSYIFELYSYALFIALMPILISILLIYHSLIVPIPFFAQNLTISDILVGVFLMDYLTTVVAAYFEREPLLLFYGLFFIFIRYLDSLIYIGSVFVAYFWHSTGIWKSPKRV